MGGGAAGTAGATLGALGFGIAVRSAPHFSQYFASSSFRAPHRLQNMRNHRKSMLPVVDCRVTRNVIDAALYVASSGA